MLFEETVATEMTVIIRVLFRAMGEMLMVPIDVVVELTIGLLLYILQQ
ncbi:hypothetical protein QJ133_02630 [Priestia megaterium]|nr:hypothetical protein [Priestia megaterium]MDI3090071.1 hypothetical protein [Priestia megaterium]